MDGMCAPRPTDSRRDAALALLESFCQRLLPGVLRRIGAWKGIPARQLADLHEDVLQELRVDCLQHAHEVWSMPARARHARWMQLSERTVYRLRRHLRRSSPLLTDACAVPAEPEGGAATPSMPPIVTLHNGRANVSASARAAGLGRRAMRGQLDRMAAQLGWDDRRRRFWTRRAAEALTALAADTLRAAGLVSWPTDAPAPDLPARRARLQRLALRFPVQPATSRVRRALQPWLRRRRADPDPAKLLRDATELAPTLAAGWLWLFETLRRGDDHRRAAAALRRASRCPDLTRSWLVLARGRLLLRRGRSPRAAAMLRRARARRDPDGHLQRELTRIRE
jgi:hypothetical protein